jgi:GNAT superfamily N-acetyltransferase
MDEPQLILYRRNLLDIPAVEVPAGYTIRPYRDGDEERLTPVFQVCFDSGWSPDRIIKTFVEDFCWSPARMCVLCHGDETVGTATAWEARERRGHGMLSYLAILPEHRGKRLGYVLTARVLNLLERMGYPDVWVATDDWWLPAIQIYLKLGFAPVYTDKSHKERWEIIRHKLQIRPPTEE